jgi:hypothetical protein
MSIDFDDRIKEKTHRPRRWTVGRVMNDLAIIMVAVPLGIYFIKGGVTNSGSDFLGFSLMLGLPFLAVRLLFQILKPLNDRLDDYLPNHTADPKPPPLDDF